MTCYVSIEFITEEFFYKEHKHYRLIKTGKYYAKVIKTKQRSLACFRQIEPNEEKRKPFN